MKIPKYTRVSEELKKKIILSLDHLTLEQAGKDNLPEGYSLSAVSVYNLLKKASIRSFYHSFPTSSSAIHVQLDEKYIHMRNARKKAGKQRLYTATIFSGIIHNKKRNMLKNRMIISSRNLTTLFNKINYFLKYIYNVSLDSHIFISDDLAIYIQISPDRITVCKATYVLINFMLLKLLSLCFIFLLLRLISSLVLLCLIFLIYFLIFLRTNGLQMHILWLTYFILIPTLFCFGMILITLAVLKRV